MPFSANPFTGSAFSTMALTSAINILPNRYGRLEQLNLMPGRPTRVRNISVEERDGVLSLLPTAAVGSPGTVGTQGKRKVRSFVIPHIPHDDIVLPQEVQGIRAFGSENDLAALADVMAMHLQDMRDKHAITLEWLRMGALKGIIHDADGSVLYNLFAEFQIAPKTIDFELSNDATDVKAKCLELQRWVEDKLLGEFMTDVRVLVSPEFFDALTSHKAVIQAFTLFNQSEALRVDQRKGFTFAGVTFEEYRGQATDSNGIVRRFIEDGEGHAFPTGTSQTFFTYFAPGDFNDTVNTLGLPIYTKIKSSAFDRGTDIHTQSNPLPMCLRPAILVKVKK